MTNVLKPHSYAKSVFINCPFDSDYEPLFRGIIFVVHHMDLEPKSAIEASDRGQPRLDKIVKLIESCKYSIHDLSLTELDPNHGFPRFNVPFELGLDLGCKRYGKLRQREKMTLILDVDRHRSRMFMSDIAGLDVEEHKGSVATAITVVRNWLRQATKTRSSIAPSGAIIHDRYQTFHHVLPRMCDKLNWDVNNLPFADYSWAVYDWIKNNPI